MSEKHTFISSEPVPKGFDVSTLKYPRDKFDLVRVENIATYNCTYNKRLRNDVRTYSRLIKYPTVTLKCKTCGSLKTCRDNKDISCRVGPCAGTWVDLHGQRFGRLVALEYVYGLFKNRHTKGWYWKCQCDCGKICYKDNHDLVHSRHVECPDCARKSAHEAMKVPLVDKLWRKSFMGSRKAAFKRGYEFELTLEQYKELCEQPCYYCGAEPEAHRHDALVRNGIDRFDNTKGYSLDNCVPCCHMCNWMKLDVQFPEWFAHMEQIIKHCNERSTTISQESTPKQAETDSDQTEEVTQPEETSFDVQPDLGF